MALVIGTTTNAYTYASISGGLDAATEAFTLCLRFKTGSTITADRWIAALADITGNLRGFGVWVDDSRRLSTFIRGADYKLPVGGELQPNTVYSFVMTRSAGVGASNQKLKIYRDNADSVQMGDDPNSIDPQEGAIQNYITLGNVYWGGWSAGSGIKLINIGFWKSVLSDANIAICLDKFQTPLNSSVSPLQYWSLATNGNAGLGGQNMTLGSDVTFDADPLVPVGIATLNDPVRPGETIAGTTGGYASGAAVLSAEGISNNVTITGSSDPRSFTGSPWQNLADNTAYPILGQEYEFTLTQGATVSTIERIIGAPNGFSLVQLINPETEDLTYPTANFDVEPVSDDIAGYVTSEVTMNSTGRLNTDAAKKTVIFHQVFSTGFVYIYEFTINEAGDVVSVVSIGTAGVIKIDDGSLTELTPIVTANMGDLVSILLETTGAGSYFARNVNAPGGSGTFISKLWVNGEIAPYPGDIIATAYDGTNYASIDCELVIPDNFLEQIFASPLATTTQYLPYWINQLGLGPAVNGEHVYWEFTGGNNVEPNGLVEGAMAGTFPFYYHKANHYVYVLMVTMEDDGVITNVELVGVDGNTLTQRGITRRGLTARSLTSRNLS